MTAPQVIAFGLEAAKEIFEAIVGAATGKLTPEESLEKISASTRRDAEVDAKAKGKLDEARQEIAAKFGEDGE